jgi:hypothetical protein
LLAFVALAACGKQEEKERVEAVENRLQAMEFQIATLAEAEPRVLAELQKKEESYLEWFRLVDKVRQTQAEDQTQAFALTQRVEATEEYIRAKQLEEEMERPYKTPDGTIPDAWKQLADKCALDKAGEAQTTLNFLVRVDRFMSEFPVHHPVSIRQEDPLVCMTSNLARESAPAKKAYRDEELSILKSRDQWLGYRVDRSWESRPERGECKTACCSLDLEGTWSCEWTWEGGRWECEYDVEGWRDYRKRYHRKCDYLQGTHDFYSMPYLMSMMKQKELPIPDALYCVVDLVWENRISCLSHGQYPVMEIRVPFDPETPVQMPAIPRYTLLKVTNWDVLYKDEWTSTWIIRGAVSPEFLGQVSGFDIELLQEPACCPAEEPEKVLAVERQLACVPAAHRAEVLANLITAAGFKDELDFEIQRMGMEREEAWKAKLLEIRTGPCQTAP